MCEFGDGIKSGQFPAVVYLDETRESKEVCRLLDSAGATYVVSDAIAHDMRGPVVVVDGCFLGMKELKDVLEVG